MKNKLLFLTIITIFWVAVTGCITVQNSEERALGEKLYKEHCAECHGEGAQGEDPQNQNGGFNAQGKRLAPALNGTAHSWHHSPKLLLRYIQEGSRDKSSPMPSYGDILNKNESLAIIAYYQSLWPKEIRQNYEKRFNK